MKKVFIISILILLVVLKSSAQVDEFIPFYSFGLKQGLNYSSVGFNPGIKQGATLGYTGGLVYNYQSEKNFALQIELNYTQKGWTEDLDTLSNSYSRKLDYIELPFITQIIMGKRPKMKIYFNLGTSFAYFLSEKENAEINNEDYRREYYEKEVENYFDYSGLVELGVKLNTGIGRFQVGVKYQFTFTDLFDTTEETTYDNSQNQFWNLSITYFFLDNRN
ncbi:MAG: porin family protein [Bacteroidales bacterium]|nr:porin family protein [Bacteroidales bacterium]